MSRAAVIARQQLALRFQVAPADYAHASWWPEPFVAAFGAAMQPGARTRSHLSAWLMAEHRLAETFDLGFEPAARRFWLLPAPTVRRSALELGAALHREAIRGCVSRASRKCLLAGLDHAAIDHALSDAGAAAAAWPLPDAVLPEVPDASHCLADGAAALLGAAAAEGPALWRRARLVFPREVRTVRGDAASAGAWIAHARERALLEQPTWRWLFS